MTRRIRTTLTTLLTATATTALLLPLTACGGSGGSDDEIEGVGEGGNEEQQSETPTEEEPEGGADRPEIVLPEGWENVYEDWESDDPDEQAVLDDAREAQNAIDLAILERAPEADYVNFYHSAEALFGAKDWIEGFIENDRSIAGEVRYYNPEIAMQGDGGATITYCADESNATAVDVNTGEAIAEDSDSPEVSYMNLLQKDDRGVWVTTAVQSERKECP
ncbi:hypothetical protein [Streptomyces sp. B6B3]|uniref:hypothetical protein n=1 Tax=Streptomyces sp. B6B3 TaxID=3153570 RepID=UPI00325CEA1E